MKTFFQIIFGIVGSLFFATSCQRNSLENNFVVTKDRLSAIAEPMAVSAKKAPVQGTCNPNAYLVTLESRTLVNGNWEWVWSILNPNPGNGNNGTVQDLSHWGMQLGSCVNWNVVTSAAYSSDGLNWTNFMPLYQSDPSQGCMATPVIKFDFGTSGNAKSYYRLVVGQDLTEGIVQGYYKSGRNTGCCTFNFIGVSGCGGPVEFVE